MTVPESSPDVVTATPAVGKRKKKAKVASDSLDDLLELESLSITPKNPLLFNPVPGEPLRRLNKWSSAIPPDKPVHEQFKGRLFPTGECCYYDTVKPFRRRMGIQWRRSFSCQRR